MTAGMKAMDIPLVLNSSLPRSGSTLLQNLLAQNPLFHCTGTNDLLDMVMVSRDKWMQSAGFMAAGLANIKPRIVSMWRGMIEGFYRDEFAAGKTVFDKSRGWLSWLELIEQILERPVKAIVTVRDIRDVMASFEKIYRRSHVTDHPAQGIEQFRRLTVEGRTELLLAPDKTVGYMVSCLQDIFARGIEDRLVIVPYRELTHDPVNTIKRVCYECGLSPFTCDPSFVDQVTQEDDTVYGMDLHTIRSRVEPDEGESWRGILPDAVAEHLDQHYGFIQSLSQRAYLKQSRQPSGV